MAQDAKPTRPDDSSCHVLRVVGTQRVGHSFVRLTIEGDAAFDGEFGFVGHDQWFRLFLPNEHGGMQMPSGQGDGWYRRWLLLPPNKRAIIRNYTVREARNDGGHWLLDVDFVVHAGESGTVDGPAASWALAAKPGDDLGFLDQGMLFARADAERAIADGGRVWVIADETGLPGVEGILAAVNGAFPVTCILEVPHAHDQRELPSADVRWLVRTDAHALPGRAALAALLDAGQLRRTDYVYTVGESSLTLDVRKAAKRAGLRKDRIDFCAYWRPERRAA